MARERLRQLPDEQRSAWLDIAEAEFRARGFEGASLNGILARAGISKGQAYYYFADKGELYRAVIDRALTVLAGLVKAKPIASASPQAFWNDMAGFFERLSTVLQQRDDLAELGRGIYREASAQAAIADLIANLERGFAGLVVIGQGVGAIRTDLPQALLVDMAFAAIRAADQWFASHGADLEPAQAQALNQQVLGLFMAMLAPPDAPSISPAFLKD